MSYPRLAVLALASFMLGGCGQDLVAPDSASNAQGVPAADVASPVTVTFSTVTGLTSPRGLTFGPDGYLYVAESGTGGTTSTEGQCAQVPGLPGPGPFTGGPTATISKISPSGDVSLVADGLPSEVGPNGTTSGVASVAFLDGTLYALVVAGGCSHGNPDHPAGIYRVHSDGSWDLAADYSAYYADHPVEHPEIDDFEPDGDLFSMISQGGFLYFVDANAGALYRWAPERSIERVIDVSAHYGHIVPTGLAYHGNFYLGNLGEFPPDQTQMVMKVTPSGQVKPWIEGLTAVLGLAFDSQNRLYVLEMTTVGNYIPGTGRVLRVDRSGKRDVVASGLFFPTAMTFGPDGALYISNWGFGLPPGGGEVLRVEVQ